MITYGWENFCLKLSEKFFCHQSFNNFANIFLPFSKHHNSTAAIQVWNMWRLIVSTPTLTNLVLIDSVEEVNEEEYRLQQYFVASLSNISNSAAFTVPSWNSMKKCERFWRLICFARLGNTGSFFSSFHWSNSQYGVLSQKRFTSVATSNGILILACKKKHPKNHLKLSTQSMCSYVFKTVFLSAFYAT